MLRHRNTYEDDLFHEDVRSLLAITTYSTFVPCEARHQHINRMDNVQLCKDYLFFKHLTDLLKVGLYTTDEHPNNIVALSQFIYFSFSLYSSFAQACYNSKKTN